MVSDIRKPVVLHDPKRPSGLHLLASHAGESIWFFRLSRGLTQRDLAALVGTKPSVIARWESGKALPTMRSLARIAHAYGAKVRITFEIPEDFAESWLGAEDLTQIGKSATIPAR